MPMPLKIWEEAITGAAREVAEASLGFGECSIGNSDEASSLARDGWMGAAIPITSREATFRLGLLSDPQGCENLARALLGMDSGELLSGDDMADALREIVNILAGGAKRRMIGHDDSLKLGLPTFLTVPADGPMPGESLEVSMCLGPVGILLHVIRDPAGN